MERRGNAGLVEEAVHLCGCSYFTTSVIVDVKDCTYVALRRNEIILAGSGCC